MVNVKFTKEILDTEMTVVRNEFERGENSPASILSERVASTAYLWHNYGKSTIGSKDDLEKVPVNRLAEFYKKFYQPDNAVLVITGRIDEAKTLQMVADSMGKLPRPTRVLDQTYTVEPPQDGERFVTLRRVGPGTEPDRRVSRRGRRPSGCGGDPGAGRRHERRRRRRGGGRGGGGARRAPGEGAGRYRSSRSRRTWASGSCTIPGLIEVSATLTKDQSLDAARDAIYKALEDVVKNPPTREEVERVRSQLLRGLENNLSNRSRSRPAR